MTGTEALIAASAVLSGVGAAASGMQAAAAADYNAQVAERDAQMATQAAAFEEDLHRERLRKTLSAQRVATGASGGAMEGSPLIVMQQTAEDAEIDALAIRYGGSVEAARAQSRAAASRMEARAARTGAVIGAGASLLSGGAKIADRRDALRTR